MNKVLLINGSPAELSHTGVLLKYIEGLFANASLETKFINLNDLQLPYNNPVYHKDALQSDVDKVRTYAADVAWADVIVLGSPLYHGSFSGMLKVALDNLDGDAFEGKKIILASNASQDRGSLQAGNELVLVCRTMHGDVFYRQVGSSKVDYDNNQEGRPLVNEDIKERCQMIVESVIAGLR